MIQHQPVDALDLEDLRLDLLDALKSTPGEAVGFTASTHVVAALLNLAQALVEKAPSGPWWDRGEYWKCEQCDRISRTDRYDMEHKPDCLYKAARTLLGPPSGWGGEENAQF
jgi:hypothetical protein